METRSNTAELQRTFAEYVQYNHREIEFLRRHQVKNFLIRAYQEGRAIAPTRERIAAKVKSLGWRVIKRGLPEQWGKEAYKTIPKENMRKMKKQERAAEKQRRAAAVAAIDNLKKMQDYVIQKRASKIGYIASVFAVAARKIGIKVGKVGAAHGSAFVSDSPQQTTITGKAAGLIDVENRTGFIQRAVDATTADMRVYIYARQKMGRERILR